MRHYEESLCSSSSIAEPAGLVMGLNQDTRTAVDMATYTGEA